MCSRFLGHSQNSRTLASGIFSVSCHMWWAITCQWASRTEGWIYGVPMRYGIAVCQNVLCTIRDKGFALLLWLSANL